MKENLDYTQSYIYNETDNFATWTYDHDSILYCRDCEVYYENKCKCMDGENGKKF